jgi:hypothetical protein
MAVGVCKTGGSADWFEVAAGCRWRGASQCKSTSYSPGTMTLPILNSGSLLCDWGPEAELNTRATWFWPQLMRKRRPGKMMTPDLDTRHRTCRAKSKQTTEQSEPETMRPSFPKKAQQDG